MKKISLVLFISFFVIVSCGGTEESSSLDEGQDNDSAVAEVVDPCTEDNVNDVSDSLIMIFDDIMKKKCDYNKAKFEVALGSWMGSKATIPNLVISSLNQPNEFTEKYRVVATYGDVYDCLWIPFHISIFADFESKEEMAKFDIGETTVIEGIISYMSAGDGGYSVHFDCANISKQD
jgi:hypothetical protein